jgi:hypothetical protein
MSIFPKKFLIPLKPNHCYQRIRQEADDAYPAKAGTPGLLCLYQSTSIALIFYIILSPTSEV